MNGFSIPKPLLGLVRECEDCKESLTYPDEYDLCEYHDGMFDGWALHNVFGDGTVTV